MRKGPFFLSPEENDRSPNICIALGVESLSWEESGWEGESQEDGPEEKGLTR